MPVIKEKPCPFCGGLELDPINVDTEDREGTPMCVECTICGARGPWAYCKDDDYYPIIKEWNKRIQ